MTPEQLETAKSDFIQERIAIMIHDAGMPPEEAIAQAEECWLRYRKQYKVYINEQKGFFDDAMEKF